MRVFLIFEPAYDGEAPDAVWISDTAPNREWFEGNLPRLDAQSAIFPIPCDMLDTVIRSVTDRNNLGWRYETTETAAIQMVWNVQDHHPEWTEITVTGVPLTPKIAADLKDGGLLAPTAAGFRLTRS